MTLKERLLADMKQTMKEKDMVKKNAVQMVRAGVLQEEKDKRRVLDDKGVMELIAREVKKRKDALVEYKKSGRDDLIANLEREIKVLSAYLPEPLSEQEIQKIVKVTIDEVNAEYMKDMGKVMQALMPKLKGRADGKMVSEMVKQALLT